MGTKNKRRGRVRLAARVPRPAIAVFALVVTLTLAYLWMGHRCSKYGEDIGRLEWRNTALENERVREETKLNAMKTAAPLEGLLLKHGYSMGYPQSWQVVRMDRGAAAAAPATVAEHGAAARGGGAWTTTGSRSRPPR